MPFKPVMIEVKSSNIASIGYDDFSSTLCVKFNNGSVYSYSEVPKDVYDSFRNEESIGGFFAKNIKGKFPCTKVEL